MARRPLGTLSADDVSFEPADAPAADAGLRPIGEMHIVSPAYFETLRTPIVAGRGFDDRDRAGAVPAAIVSEAFVRDHLQGRSPIGLQIAVRPAGAPQAKPAPRQIVGVARQVKDRPDEIADIPQIYVPLAQNAVDDIFLMVRAAAGNATALARPVRAAIGRVDKAQLVSVRDVLTLDEIAWNATGRHRFRAVLVATFAALALVLAMVGVFGVLAYAVQQRRRDFGVRRALGATTGDLVRLVAGSALRVVGAGTIIGLALAAASGRVLTTLLFGVAPLDPATFILVTAALIVTAMIAVAGPAWRATRIDPAVALRGD